MKLNNRTKLILTIICMVICLIAMFLAIMVASKTLFSDIVTGEVTYISLDADVELYINGYDMKESKQEADYICKNEQINKESTETSTTFTSPGTLVWAHEATKDNYKVKDINFYIAITNTGKNYLEIKLNNSETIIENTSIKKTYYEGIGVIENLTEVDANTYKGVTLDEGAQGVAQGYGIPQGYTYVLRIKCTLNDISQSSLFRDCNLFSIGLTDSNISNTTLPIITVNEEQVSPQAN